MHGLSTFIYGVYACRAQEADEAAEDVRYDDCPESPWPAEMPAALDSNDQPCCPNCGQVASLVAPLAPVS